MSRPNSFQQTTQLLKSGQGSSLEQKLGLYQVFQRLYEANPALLDELIALENLSAGQPQKATTPLYIIGNRDAANHVSLTTNLLGDRSQVLTQPEQVWLIGRAPDSGLCLGDARLSRYHAAIQFSPDRGFELVDLGSTNGSFINGEAVRHRKQLQDGDRLRLGSLTISFFEQCEATQLPEVPDVILEQLGKEPEPVTPTLFASTQKNQQVMPSPEETLVFQREELPAQAADPAHPGSSDPSDPQARLLERLKQMS